MVTSSHTGGVFQYENLIAESVWNQRDRYQIVMICNDSYWINWCIERNIRFVEEKVEVYRKMKLDMALKHPYISTLYQNFISDKGKLIQKENFDLLIFGQQGMFIPNLLLKQVCPVHDLMHRYETRFPERSRISEDKLIWGSIKYASGILTDSRLGKTQVIESYLSKKKHRPLIQVLPYTVSRHIKESEEEYIDRKSVV